MDDTKEFKENTSYPIFFSARLLICVLGFFLTMVLYMQRVNMSIAIVCMVNNTAVNLKHKESKENISNSNHISSKDLYLDTILNETNTQNNGELIQRCFFESWQNKSKMEDGKFHWNKETQGAILSSFFYGYIFTQILGGILSIRFGPKIVLGISMLISSIFTILIPITAEFSIIALILCRFITGFANGMVKSSLNTLWPNWIPPNERSRLIGITITGALFGNVITFPLGGILCKHGYGEGWPSLFYLIGAIGIFWCIFWLLLASNSPNKHRFINSEEKIYIFEQTKHVISNSNKKLKTPWGPILKSKQVWGLILTHSCANFGAYVFLTQLPTYLSEILHFDIEWNGSLSATPFLAIWIVSVIGSIISDAVLNKTKISRTTIRKVFNTIGFAGPFFSVLALNAVDCSNPYVGIIIIILGLGINGFAVGPGFEINFNDISGCFSGVVYGFSNTISSIPAILAPYLVGIITQNKKQEEWQIVFIITAVVYFIGALSFILFCEAETQKWALKDSTNQNNIEEIISLKN